MSSSKKATTPPPDVAHLSEADVLRATGNGTYGPAIIGEELHARSQAILRRQQGGVGPAIGDDAFAQQQADELAIRRANIAAGKAAVAASRAAAPAESGGAPATYDPADLAHPSNPWTYVTLGGAKQLAMKAGISHTTRVKRAELIAELHRKGVTPPPVPTDTDDDPEDED